MADEQNRWLDRETAERLLRCESLDTVDATARDQAERLADALGALSADIPLPGPSGAELPGEAAALAAFRTARTGRNGERAALGQRARVPSSDAGLVRIGRPVPADRRSGWGGPARLGLTAALAVGMIGGVAFAAGTGALPSPFHDDPAPGVSISAAATPDRPPGSAAPHPTVTAGPGSSAPGGGATAGSPAGGSADGTDGTAGTGTDPGSTAGNGKPGGASWWKGVASSCRDVRAGKSLDSGRRHTLEGAAGGSSRVGTYCRGILKRVDGGSGSGSDSGGKGTGQSGQGGQNGQGGEEGIDQETPGDQGGWGGDHDGRTAPGHGGHQANGTAATPQPSAFAPLVPLTPRNTAGASGRTADTAASTPAPGRTYSPNQRL
ncbi:hypothetical protein [Streptomyces sp. NPDC005423]|uniref:hypothetical protein n=1 Tax=Streptomyces sp. NPDC005423 TaxID=3155343 RepID=UPI0033BC7234